MKVLHLIAKMDTGGAESLVVEMIQRGASVSWDSSLATAGGVREDELLASGELDGVHRVHLSERRLQGVATAIRDTRMAFDTERPDLVIAHNVGMTLIASLARVGMRRPPALVTVFHGVAAEDYGAAARILRLCSDHVVTVSQAIADRLVAHGMKGTPTTVIRNAITMGQLPDRSQARASLDLPLDAPVALCLARLAEQKRHDNLLAAFSQVDASARLLIAGDGPLEAPLKKQATDLGLGDRVRFLGRRRDIPNLLAAADCTVLASDWEGLPISVLESLASGVPMVATDVDGRREVIGQGGGLLVPPKDVSSLAQGLTTMLFDDALRAEASVSGLRIIEERYSPTGMMSAYDTLLRDLMRSRHRSSATVVRRMMGKK